MLLPVLVWAVVGWSTGCIASRSAEPHAFDRYFEAGSLAAAESAFREDSTLRRHPRSVYRAGLVYALPHSPARDLGRALELLRSYLEMRPEGERAEEARRLVPLLEEVAGLRRRIAELQDQLEQLKAVDLERTPPDTARGGLDPGR